MTPAAPLRVPAAPERLVLPIRNHWDGRACPESRRHGAVALQVRAAGLVIAAELAHQPVPRIPAAPAGTRVEGLWEFDVVECFLVAADGRYLEIELGAGGHYLALGFHAPRQRAQDHADWNVEVAYARDDAGWRSELVVPWERVPQPVVALNAFAIADGAFLAHAPLPGAAPDFHQPSAYPAATLAPAPVA